MGDWVEDICKIFQEEIILYKKLLDLELEKRIAVNSADGKKLQEITKESYHLMVNTSELERVRMKTLEDIYKKENLEDTGGITLSDFLNKIDRESNFKLKSYATDLKSTVHKLKDAIIVNEKLIQTRQEILKKTVSEMQELNAETTYSPKAKIQSGANKAKSLVLDASV